MSLLLGVRGSSQNAEGQPFHEGIIQQPGSFYNGNPSSSIWGNPPTQPRWDDLPSAIGISPSSSLSSTAVPSMSSASLGHKKGIGMVQDMEEKQWQKQPMKREIATGKTKQDDTASLRAGEYGYNIDRMQQFSKPDCTYGKFDSSGPQSSFRFSSRQDTTASNSFKFTAKDPSQELPNIGKFSGEVFDEGGRKASNGANAHWKNEKSWKFVATDKYASQSAGSGMPTSVEDLSKKLESRLSMQGSSLITPLIQHAASSKDTLPLVRSDFVSARGGSTCSSQASENLAQSIFSDPKITSSEKKKISDVFVFGASEFPRTRPSSNAPHQQSFQSSYAAPFSRSRGSKFKRQSSAMKGKGQASHGVMHQFASKFSRDASPQSNTGFDSNTESSRLDEAECSDVGIWPEENLDTGMTFEPSKTLQPSHSTGEKGMLDELSTWPPEVLSNTADEDIYSHNNFDQHDHISHYVETQPAKSRQNLGALFSPSWPFHNKSDGDSKLNWEGDGSFNTLKGEYNATYSGDVTGMPSGNPRQPELGAAFGEASDFMPSQMYTYPEVLEFSDKTSSNLCGSGQSFFKEPMVTGISTGEHTHKSGWNSSKEPSKPFVFGSSWHFLTGSDVNRESGNAVSKSTSAIENAGTLKNEKLHLPSEDFPSGCDHKIDSESTLSFPSFSFELESRKFVHEEPSSMERRPLSHVSSTDIEFAKKNFHNQNSSDFMRSSSFVERDNAIPTGEFSGPLSSSESSASESSPSRGEGHQERENPSNKARYFEFQGSMKEKINTGKKKSRATSNIRKLGRGVSRLKRSAHATSFKDTAATSMDYSPRVNVDGLSSGSANLEQPNLNDNEYMNMDNAEMLRQLPEYQSMKDFTAAAAGLSLGSEQESIAFWNDKQVSENLNDWTDHKVSRRKGSGQWKRLGSDEGQISSTSWENTEVAQHSEREFADGYMFLNTEERNYGSPFTFRASSPTASSFLNQRVAQRPQEEKAAEFLEDFTSFDSTSAGGPDSSEIMDQERVSDKKIGASYFSQAIVDKKEPFKTVGLNHQSSSYSRNTEDLSALNTGSSPSSHHFVSGVSESSMAVKSAAAEQVCEKWRLRGNQAYANGDFPKAEEYYSRGASSVSPDETSQSCIRASMLCYSNRAATRMAVGRMREALTDCKRAMVVDPSFLRVRLRAASCHLALGENKAAAHMFKECLKYAKESTKPDNKILSEAMEGAKKSQQVDEYSERASELLQKQTSMDSSTALRLINEALSISSFSETLHEVKAQALLSLRRYEECLQLCEQSLLAAVRNHGAVVNEQQYPDFSLKESCQRFENIHLKLWRWRLSAKALYHLGKLDEALDLLVKHEEALPMGLADKITKVYSLAPFLANIRDLLRHKAAGNEAFQNGKHAEAVEHYTAALACNGDSRPYNAVCFCNRAAASQALGHIADAIADCSRAIALDPNYPKALSRRATLHELIRDYGQACNDLRRLITLLEEYQVDGKNDQAAKGGGLNVNVQDLRQARERCDKGEEEMKKGYPIDHYLVLGVDFLCSASEIKKAYRKAALKHHPDKAGQFLARAENGDDGSLWKEVGDEVRRDSERLFKLIGEANAILSDPTKRLRYDTDEDLRKQRLKDSNIQVPSSTTESYRSQYEKSGRRQRDRWDAWQGYAPQHQRWQSGPDAAQPDTYGRRSTYGADPAKTGKASWTTDFSWD